MRADISELWSTNHLLVLKSRRSSNYLLLLVVFTTGKNFYNPLSLPEYEFAKLRVFRSFLPYVTSNFTRLRALHAFVPSRLTCFHTLRALIFTGCATSNVIKFPIKGIFEILYEEIKKEQC